MVSALANDGFFFKPKLISKSVNAITGEIQESKRELARSLNINPEYFEFIRQAAKEVVHHPKGTGKKAGVKGISIGGKTGTAQVVSLKSSKDSEKGGSKKYGDHSIFLGFAPVENPTIAVFVLVEHGGHGGSAAAPIAGEIFKTYFIEKGMIDPEEVAPSLEKTQEVKKLQRARLEVPNVL